MSYSPARIGPEKDANVEQEKKPTVQRPTPSWFVDVPARDLAGTYRAQREARERLNPTPEPSLPEPQYQQFEERFENARRLFDRPGRDVHEMQHPLPRVRRPVLTHNVMASPESLPKINPAPARKSHLSRYVAMTAFAVVIGTAIGFGVAKRDVIAEFAKGKVQQASVSLPNFKAWSETPEATPAPVSKKEVSMASLDVNDARGALNSMIPLMLHAAAADAANPIDIKISGLPPSACF